AVVQRFAPARVQVVTVDARCVGTVRAAGMTELLLQQGQSGIWLVTTDADWWYRRTGWPDSCVTPRRGRGWWRAPSPSRTGETAAASRTEPAGTTGRPVTATSMERICPSP